MPVSGGFTACNCGPNNEACHSPTEPAATVGLCLADGIPIAVIVTRDCDGMVVQDGWINLTTGAWSAGAPPAGTVACGDSRSIQVSGTFCDVDAAGAVLGLVLVEYEYAADGTIANIRLVDATTGAAYTPSGSITVCPGSGGAEAPPEQGLAVLCDVDPATGSVTAFLRDYRRDETGAMVGHTDYALDGAPYTVTGDVGQCECCGQPPPEQRVDVETGLLCMVDDTTGDVLGRVLVERLYDGQSGDRIEQRYVDPVTGDTVTVPAGASVTVCPPDEECPRPFDAECMAELTRTAASYDNTSMLGGVAGECGTVQGPEGVPGAGPSFACDAGPYTITSWIVDGVDVVVPGSEPMIDGGPCGDAADSMHTAWAAALTALDPTGATWIVGDAPGCSFHVRSDGETSATYGQLVITGNSGDVDGGTWLLGPVQSCTETLFTRVLNKECDGTITVRWLDQAGAEVEPPTGDLVPCGTGCAGTVSAPLDARTGTHAAGVATFAAGELLAGPTISGGLVRLVGGQVTVPPGAETVTVTVLAGVAWITIGPDGQVPVPAGAPPLTWTAGPGSVLADAYTITARESDDVLISVTIPAPLEESP